MLTGQYPHLHRVTDNHTHFPATATTYATLLQETGYATGYFGKWHAYVRSILDSTFHQSADGTRFERRWNADGADGSDRG